MGNKPLFLFLKKGGKMNSNLIEALRYESFNLLE